MERSRSRMYKTEGIGLHSLGKSCVLHNHLTTNKLNSTFVHRLRHVHPHHDVHHPLPRNNKYLKRKNIKKGRVIQTRSWPRRRSPAPAAPLPIPGFRNSQVLPFTRPEPKHIEQINPDPVERPSVLMPPRRMSSPSAEVPIAPPSVPHCAAPTPPFSRRSCLGLRSHSGIKAGCEELAVVLTSSRGRTVRSRSVRVVTSLQNSRFRATGTGDEAVGIYMIAKTGLVVWQTYPSDWTTQHTQVPR